MSANPFSNVMQARAKAAFDGGGQFQSDIPKLDPLSADRLATFGNRTLSPAEISGQPPLVGYEPAGFQLKVGTPPLELDFNTTIADAPGTPRTNKAGILKEPLGKASVELRSQPQETPETLEIANLPQTTAYLPRRSPALNFAEFSIDAERFRGASYDLSMATDGKITHTYTAKDFSTYKMYSKPDGTYGAIVTDRYNRPLEHEEIGANGSTISRFTYDDSTKTAMFASRKEVTLPDGTTQTMNYNRYGQVVQA